MEEMNALLCPFLSVSAPGRIIDNAHVIYISCEARFLHSSCLCVFLCVMAV